MRFQSTPSYEGEPDGYFGRFARPYISIHSLIRGRTTAEVVLTSENLFQSTPSYEGEQYRAYRCRQKENHFNPLPHTRENGQGCREFEEYSTHFNPLPHTRENGASRPDKSLRREFQSTPSYEGELYIEAEWTEQAVISIHSLIRGRTVSPTFHFFIIYAFQSTPSYEGEHAIDCLELALAMISIHSLIRGRTWRCVFALFCAKLFQSTPSYEGERRGIFALQSF